jgi:hypothetical protein
MCVQIAIFLVGLTTQFTGNHVIPSVVRHVIHPWGRENVDFFVHTSPMDSMAMDDSDVMDLYESGLESCLRGIVVDRKFREAESINIKAKKTTLQACKQNKATFQRQNGIDHPAVYIDLPSLECACDSSNASSISSDGEQGGDASSHESVMPASACRAGGQASWILSVRGLVPGFIYGLHFKWFHANELLGSFDSVISTDTSSYIVRKALSESGQDVTSIFDLIAHSRKLRMDVAVRDMYPGLTEEKTLIGTRHIDSAVNTVRIHCSRERRKVPDGESNRSASVKDDFEQANGDRLVERDDCIKVVWKGDFASFTKMDGNDTWVPRIWDPPTSHTPYFQFYRLAHLYPYMLAEEGRARRRYSHVVRMRTDALQYSTWDRIQQFRELIPSLKHVVSGPGFNNLRTPSFMVDSFWIASRAAASSVFVGFAHSLETPVDRKELFGYFNCPWPPKSQQDFASNCFNYIFAPHLWSKFRWVPWTEIRKCSKVQSWCNTRIHFCGEKLY